MGMLSTCLIIGLSMAWAAPESQVPQPVRIPLTASGEIDLGEVVARLSVATGQSVARPPGPITLPINGPAGLLTRRLVSETLGPDVTITLQGGELVIDL